jgi:hypothetical protein
VDDIEKKTMQSADLFPFRSDFWLNARSAGVVGAYGAAGSHKAAATKGGGAPRR